MRFRSPQRLGMFSATLAVAVSLHPAFGQTDRSTGSPAVPQASTQQSPFGGTVVEDVVAQVNDQIITRSDYERAEQDLEQRARQQNMSPQEVEAERRDLLRDLVDQQLLLSKGKELGITGETELIRELNDIRKQNHLDTMEDLQKAAESQGVNYEDFKENIRNRIITQQVIRDEVGRHLNITPADVQHYYDQHNDEFNKPETVTLSEILVPDAATAPADGSDDPAKAKIDAIEAKLKAGGDFDAIAKDPATGSTAPQGGDLGVFGRDKLPKVIEDQTFSLKAGQFTEPIRTRQGYIILKVTDHTPGGQLTLKDVEPQVEDALAQERVQPAVRAYLAQARQEAYIDYKPGYVDTAAVVNPGKPVYSAYVPPAPKKKKKAATRTRFRERSRSSKETQTASTTPGTGPATTPSVPSLADVPHGDSTVATDSTGATTAAPATTVAATPATETAAAGDSAKTGKTRESARKKTTTVASTMKPGKKEKIRYGQAPRETLPTNDNTRNIDAHSTPDSSSAVAPADTQIASAEVPDETPQAPKAAKKRFSDRAKLPKVKKPKGPKVDPLAPPPATAEETATRQTQSTPLGLAGDTAKPVKKKKVKPTEKTRLEDQKKPVAPAPAPTTPDLTTPTLTTDQTKPQAPTTPAPDQPGAPATPLGTNPVQTPPTNTQGVPTPGDGSSTTPPPPPQ
jgi:peptidyl-prolyl cis-trans isomerase SurA